MQRILVVVALLIAALFIVPAAQAECFMDFAPVDNPGTPINERQAFLDTIVQTDTGFGNGAGDNVHEYALMFHEIRQDDCNTEEMRTTFTRKLQEHHRVGGFGNWLSGGMVSLAYATGMVLGANGQLTADQDRLLGNLNWNPSIAGDCGWEGFEPGTQLPRWKRGDNCFDDYAVAAEGYAWRAAYFSKANINAPERTIRSSRDLAEAIEWINRSLTDTGNSICIYDPALGVNGPSGPCNSTIAALRDSMRDNGNVQLLPINHVMENANYGIGLIASLANAFVGLEAMNALPDYSANADIQTVMTALFLEGQHASTPGGEWAFACYRAATELGDATKLTETDFTLPGAREKHCQDRSNASYRIALYPLAEFYEEAGFDTGDKPGFGFTIGEFESLARSYFFDNNGKVLFNTVGRWEIYRTMGWEFWTDDRARRPDFDFDFEPQPCPEPDMTLIHPTRVQSKQQHITVRLNPQPAGTIVTWLVFNADPPGIQITKGETPGEDPSFITFNAGCVADHHPAIRGLIQVIAKVETNVPGCDKRVRENHILITHELPTALVEAPNTTINAGESAFIPVYLTGVGDWRLIWSDGFIEVVRTDDTTRPYRHVRTARPDQTTTYKVDEVITRGCENPGTEGGFESGTTTVTVIPKPVKATPLIFVEDTIASAGVQKVFKARMSTVGGGYVEGAVLRFFALGNFLGSATTDEDGRASVIGIVDGEPEITRSGAVVVVFDGSNNIKAGTGSGSLKIICFESLTVIPAALNVPRIPSENGYHIAVIGSQYCTPTPEVAFGSRDWLSLDNISATGFTIKVAPLASDPRRGFVHVGAKNVEINQAGDCSFVFSPPATFHDADNLAGAITTMSVLTNVNDCKWVVRSDESWVKLLKSTGEETGKLTGTGDGEVRFRVDTNRSDPRDAHLILKEEVNGVEGAETKATGYVNQYAPPPCVEPRLIRDIDGYSVTNGQNVVFHPVFEGTNLRYTLFVDGFPVGAGFQPTFILARWSGFYPTRTEPKSFRVVVDNDCGGASTGTATFHYNTPSGDTCLVPDISHPGLHSSSGGNVRLSVSATGPKGEFEDDSFKYKWYRAFPNDTANEIGTGRSITVSPGSDAFYFATVDDEDDTCGVQYSGVGAVFVTKARKRRSVASHDMSGDGRSDLVFHNTVTGQNQIWAMVNGTRPGAPITLPSSAPNERIQSIGDINGDEEPDLILRNPADGTNRVWYMHNASRIGNEGLASRSGADWSIGGVADLDDDENHDIVWHNDATGETEIWFQEGVNRAGSFTLPPTGPNWGLHGAQDFTRDDKPDLFFHNRATGQASVWIMDNGRPVITTSSGANADGETGREPRRRPRMKPQSLGTMQDTNYLPAAVADFNGDEMPDIVWRHKTTGEQQLWIMSFTNHSSTNDDMTDQPDLTWQSGGGGSTTGNGGSGGGTTPGGSTTTLTVSAQSAPFNGAAIVTATLTAGSAPVSSRSVIFSFNGTARATLLTDATGSVTAAISVAGMTAGTHNGAITVRFDGDGQYSASSASADLVIRSQPATLSWPEPAPISYGTPLSATQLNATASASGTFVYVPPAGTILDAGYHALDVTFTPSDPSQSRISRSTVLLVNKTVAAVTWPAPAAIYHGTPLSPVQLNATTSASTPGSFIYAPPSGTILAVGTHPLQATFEAEGLSNYDIPPASATITVLQGTQTIHWAALSPITYGTPLTAAMLNATVATTGPSHAGALTYSPAAGTILPAGTHTLTAIAAPTQYLTGAGAFVELVVNPALLPVQWSNPASIVYGTALSSAQLNATASVPGTFTYSPATGTVLTAGTHTLTVTFTPNDTANYQQASKSVSIAVTKTTPIVTWSAPTPIIYGAALSSTQLNATANVPGTFVYAPAAGTILNAGNGHTLSAQFTPTDTVNYNSVSATTTINVAKAQQTLSWSNPAPIVYGTVLSGSGLNATVSVVGPSPAGALTYNPPAGTLLQAGNGQGLTVSAAATANYEAASKSVTIDVLKAMPVITWATPAPIIYRTALSATQLNATANVAGSFVYTPAAGTVLEAALQTLSAHFTPSDANNYERAAESVTLEVRQATPIITWSAPAGIVYGTALSAAQLNATADVPGAFVYMPAAGTILNAGAGQTLSVAFTPADARNFKNASATMTIDVARAGQTLAWNAPASIVYGTPLSAAQHNATVSVVGPAAAGAFVYSPAAGTVLDAGNHTLTVIALETPNYNSATTSVSLDVTRKPLSLVVDPKSKLYGGAVPVLTGMLTGVVNNDAITPSYATTATIASPAGTYPATGTLIDPNNRLVNYSVTNTPSTLTVLPAPLQISADPKSKQYSDPLPQLTATFTGLVLGETPARLNGLLVLETTATGLSAPGTYPITIAGLTSPNYATVYVNSTLTVTQEDSRVAITSPLIISTTTTKPASITMTATIKDISATTDANGDGDAGDIRNATLAFIDRVSNTVLCTAAIGLVSASDERVGVATCTFTRSFAPMPASLLVGARVGGHYTRDAAADDATLSIVAPTADMITAGGALTVASSAGSHGPDINSNFTVNANLQYDKNGAVKGNFTFTFTGADRKYELTTVATSLAIVRTATGGKAAIVGSGTLRDVTVTTAPVVITTAPLVITATDAGEPGRNDSVSVALMNSAGGFWLATGWNGVQAVEQNMRDGNIAVHYKK